MPASPLYRIVFADGSAVELRGNLPILRLNAATGRPVALLVSVPVHSVHPASPREPPPAGHGRQWMNAHG